MISSYSICNSAHSIEAGNTGKQRRIRRGANLASHILLVILLVVNKWQPGQTQCPMNTMTSFERIGGVTIKDIHLTVLYTAPNISSMGHHFLGDLTRQLAGSLSATSLSIPITAECNNRCRRSTKCRAFLVNYERHTCYSIEQPAGSGSLASQSSLMRVPTPIQLIPTQERTSYFEKVCLNLPAAECERAWIYERVLAHHIHGHDDKIIEDVSNRLKCQEHCLNEREFRCRSGEYDYLTMQCRLSMIDRHLKPNLFLPTTSNVDYFENQCVQVGSQCDAFDRFEDMDLGRAEIMRSANTSDQCQQFCTQTIKAFICRSFTWNPLTGKCYLNSANSFMVGGQDRLVSAPGLIYYQRNDCIDLKLECDNNAMTLNLRTNEPFRGRMYVKDDPNACETMGRSALVSSLSIPFQSQARCATRELPSRYSSVVVVQQHPLIQRKSDRYIKLVCDFQTANKTISSSYNVVANPWTSTALINATSFAPKIRLRITDKFGVDITGAKLGDELYLRIEAETETIYDMVARSVLAKSGTTEESIALIDKDGCPTDYRIFPPLKKLNRRTILGKFDAFKFSSDVVVRFQVDVQFCLNQCPRTSCDNNLFLNSAELPYVESDMDSITTPGPTSPSSTLAGSDLTSSRAAPMGSSATSGGGPSNPTRLPSTPYSGNHQQHQHRNQQQRAPTSHEHQQHRSPPTSGNFSNTQAAYANPASLGSNNPANEPPLGFYNSAGQHANIVSAMQGGHQMIPANQLASLNFTGNTILESLTTSDPQIFEHSQRSAGPAGKLAAAADMMLKGARDQRQRLHDPDQQQVAGNSIEQTGSTEQSNLVGDLMGAVNGEQQPAAGDEHQAQQQQQQQQAANRRRRRSAEPLPPSPRNIPLQREIIVESSPGGLTNGRLAPDSSVRANRQQQQHLKQVRKGASKADKLAQSGPAYDVNGKF